MSILRVEHLTKTFGVLSANSDISFEVDKDELLGIIGPNGAGKSTLFNCIAGLLPVTSGRIYFFTENVTDFKAHEMARYGLARTFQVYAASGDLTVLENIMVGCFARTSSRREAQRRAEEILRIFNLNHLSENYLAEIPVAYQKLVTMAAALGTRPRMLLLDEVAAGLTPTEVEGIMKIIHYVHDEMKITVMLIEHVMTLVMNVCDRVIVLDAGKMIAQGDPEAVCSDEDVCKAYLGERYVQEHGTE